MPHGGKRPGAGRKPGKASAPAREKLANARTVVRSIMDEDRNPLTRLLEIAYDPAAPLELQFQAAHALAPFCAPRLSAAVVAAVPAGASNDHAVIIDRILGKIARREQSVATIEGKSESIAA